MKEHKLKQEGGSGELLNKLDEFIKRFYYNRLLRGLIFFTAGAVSAFLIAAGLEYFGEFSSSVRSILFFSFLGFSAFIFIRFVAIPLLALYRIGNLIDYSTASKIIGEHFSEVGDKLLNTLQMKEMLEKDQQANGLLQASIEQRMAQLRPVPFSNAVNLRENLSYLKFAIVPVLLFIGVLVLAPGFTNSSKRLVNYNTFYEKKAPFYFELQNSDLRSGQNEDFELKMIMKGSVVPAEAFVLINGNRFRMKSGTDTFSYLLRNLQKNAQLQFWADGFYSEEYELKVLPKPLLVRMQAYLDYPAYTGLKKETIQNSGDLSVPVGTKISWEIDSRNTDEIGISANDGRGKAEKNEKGLFVFSKRFLQSSPLRLYTQNNKSGFSDSIAYQIQVIPDAYPEIEIERETDSMSSRLIYLYGSVKDDYGFTRLAFRYRFISSPDSSKRTIGLQTVPIDIQKSRLNQAFYYIWDLQKLNIQPEDQLEYYFEVWDNDGVHGAKSSRTGLMSFSAPSKAEISKQSEQKAEEVKRQLDNAEKQGSEMEKDLKELEKRLAEKKSLNWEDKKKIEDAIDKQKELIDDVKKAIEKNEERMQLNQEFNQENERLQEKEQAVQEMMEEMLNEEQEELMEKIMEMMEQNKKDELREALKNMQTNEKDMRKQLERMQELYKELELEQKVQETRNKLEDLAKEQKELAEETAKSDKKDQAQQEQLKKEQEQLNKKFDDIKKDLKDIDQKNQALEKPKDLDSQKEKEQEVEKEMKDSKEQLDQGQNQKASQKQKNAAKKMEEMSNELEQMMMAAQMKQQMEDYNTLRGILENLVQLSFDQEELIKRLKQIRQYNPTFVEVAQEQKNVKDDARIIEDSLFALSKRVVQIKTFINKEMGRVNDNLELTLNDLDERRIPPALTHQQVVMTGLNNLAVMLSDVLKNMQEQMKSAMPMPGCSNPNQSQNKPMNMQQMREMQEQLGNQMKEMQKKSQQNGGKQPGSRELAETAAQQAAIRRKLEQMRQQLEKEGKAKQLGDLKKTSDIMDDLEKDLVNKRLSAQTIQRLKELEIRLLQHEKAEQEQEKEQKRKSNEGRDLRREMPPALEEYLKQKKKEEELLRTLPPNLNPYYQNKAREYFRRLD